jgi:hypothetical protein
MAGTPEPPADGRRAAARGETPGMSRSARPIACALLALLSVHAPASAHRRLPQRTAGEVRIAPKGDLGRVDAHGGLAAVLQRATGVVSFVDIRNASRPKVVGEYDDGARQSLDGDIAFSHDGTFVFYARQTVQFSEDGLHVIDVSDPAAPRLASYQPGGGALRVDTYFDGDAEWVFLLDAVTGLVVYRFVPEAGVLVPVHVDALPATKVGGPASGGLFVEDKDPQLGIPLLYATTGTTGLQVFDISDPAMPEELGAWDDVGLAEVEVVAAKTSRTVYAATEYWFEPSLKPEVVVLDAGDLGALEEKTRWSIGAPAEDGQRIQGMDFVGRTLLAAHSERSLVAFPGGELAGPWGPRPCRAPHGDACPDGSVAASIADVEVAGNEVLVTDSLTGTLTILGR